MLGPGTDGGEPRTLPFLTKVLAAARPLSIQVHPNSEQAALGYAAARSAKSAPAASESSYRDPNHKPELLYALTPFTALAGFRPPREAARLLAELGVPQLERPARELEVLGAPAYLGLLKVLGEERNGDLAHRLQEAAAARQRREPQPGPGPDPFDWTARLAEHHPDDPLLIAPLLLRLVHLPPGEALFTPPGVPHSYLCGSAVEVMASSDNVLRLGLTSKHVDVAGLLAILDVDHADRSPDERPGAADLRVRTEDAHWGRRHSLRPPVDDFQLDILRLDGNGDAPLDPGGRARIVLVLEGEVAVGNASGSERLRAGEGALAPTAARRVVVSGRGALAVTSSKR